MFQDEGGPPSSPPLPTAQFLRKRSYVDDLDLNTSSDGFFSSDDGPDPCIDDYSQKRQKALNKGSWWTTRHSRDTERKASFARNDDSGVWMASDHSVDDLPCLSDPIALSPSHLPGMTELLAPAQPDPFLEGPLEGASEQRVAQAIIRHCLDQGNEVVDLTNLGLHSVPDLNGLHTLIRPPAVGSEVPDSEVYEALTPSLQIFLSCNSLTCLPRQLWNLTNITVLSLRHNKLRFIPSVICELKNLVELNVAGNELRFLPFELLRLGEREGNLRNLTVFPNPLFQPFTPQAGPSGRFTEDKASTSNTDESLEAFSERLYEELLNELTQDLSSDQHLLKRAALQHLKDKGLRLIGLTKGPVSKWSFMLARASLKRLINASSHALTAFPREYPRFLAAQPIYLGSSEARISRFDGFSVESDPHPAHSQPEDEGGARKYVPAAVAERVKLSSANSSSGRVPSLFELALRVCYSHSEVSELRTLLPADTPPYVSGALDLAESIKRSGDKTCSICGKRYVTSFAQWVEYWFWRRQVGSSSDLEEGILPFLREACSAGCTLEAASEPLPS